MIQLKEIVCTLPEGQLQQNVKCSLIILQPHKLFATQGSHLLYMQDQLYCTVTVPSCYIISYQFMRPLSLSYAYVHIYGIQLSTRMYVVIPEYALLL